MIKSRKTSKPFAWIRNYQFKFLWGDLLAGLTVAVMLVPQGMAYAMLAGLPAIYGLYAGLVPLFVYPFFGSSNRLSVGPVAIVSILVYTGLSQFATPLSKEFIDLAILTGLLAGAIQFLLGAFRLGFLVKFLSHAVLSGFTSAAALIIGLSQIKYWVGADIPGSNLLTVTLLGVIKAIPATHLLTLLIGLVAFILIFSVKKWKPKIPISLLAIIIGSVLVYRLGWESQGVAVVGIVPEGLPSFTLPSWSWDDVIKLLPLALTICLISFIESLAIANAMEETHRDHKVYPNQELFALGLSKVAGAFFLSFPTTGSFSRSAVNSSSGAKSPLSSIISALFIGITLLFLTSLFQYLPKAVLASIVIASVIGMINYKEAIEFWKTGKRDFTTLLVTFLVTIFAGIQMGVLTGVILSLAFVIFRSSIPHFPILGRIPGTDRYRNIERFPEAEQIAGLLIMRFDAPLYFGNASYFVDHIETQVLNHKDPNLKAFILDMTPVYDIDNSGFQKIKDLHRFLKEEGLQFWLCNATGPLRDKLYKSGIMDLLGDLNQFPDVADAVDFHLNGNQDHSNLALQTDIDP